MIQIKNLTIVLIMLITFSVMSQNVLKANKFKVKNATETTDFSHNSRFALMDKYGNIDSFIHSDSIALKSNLLNFRKKTDEALTSMSLGAENSSINYQDENNNTSIISLITGVRNNFYDLTQTHKIAGDIYYRFLDSTNIDLDPYLTNKDLILEVVYPLYGNVYGYCNFIKNIDDYIILADVGYTKFNSNNNIIGAQDTLLDNIDYIGSSSNRYTTTVGDEIGFSFTGDGIAFNYYSDNRGGIWEFTIDDNEDNIIRVSTYSDEISKDNSVDLFKGLTYGLHTVKGVFIGDDINNKPNPRGWFKYTNGNSMPTFTYYDGTIMEKSGDLQKILHTNSNKEFAFYTKKATADYLGEWIPEHSEVKTTRGSYYVSIDGSIENQVFNTTHFNKASFIEVVQDMVGYNPNEEDLDLIDIKTTTSINHKGISVISSFEMLEDINITSGYVNMIPVSIKDWGTRMIDDRGNNYDMSITDGSTSTFPFKDDLSSIAVIDDSDNIFLGVEFANTDKTFLKNQTDYKKFNNGDVTRFWVQHRDTNVNKLYPQTYFNENVSKGFKHVTSMFISLGRLSGVSSFFETDFEINFTE